MFKVFNSLRKKRSSSKKGEGDKDKHEGELEIQKKSNAETELGKTLEFTLKSTLLVQS